MFFPEKTNAFSEARRVLRAGGVFIFNLWDRIEQNEFAHTVTLALEQIFPLDPPRVLARIPHGYSDTKLVARQLSEAGFDREPDVTTLAARSRAASPDIPATGYYQGTPLRNELQAWGASSLIDATYAAEAAIATQFGRGVVDGKIQAHIVVIES